MKDMIAMVEKCRKNKKFLVMKNKNKTVIAEIAKVLSTIILNSIYSQAIGNTDIDTAQDWRSISIKKYQR